MRDDRAGLAIGRESDRTGAGSFAVLLARQQVMTVINFFDRAGIGIRVAGDGIVLAIKLAGPFVVGGLSRTIYSVNHALVGATFGCINDIDILACAGGNLRFRFI